MTVLELDLTGGDVVADEEMKIVLATDWRSLVHPVGTGSGASLSNATPDALTPDQAGAAGCLAVLKSLSRSCDNAMELLAQTS